MKKWLCMVLCAGMMFGAAGCGGTEPTTEPEQQQEEQIAEEPEDAESEAADTFDFTIDEFVQSVDERLTEREKRLLSDYELVDDGETLMYKLNDSTSLMAALNEDSRKVKGFIFYETFADLSDEELGDYVSLLINSLAVIDFYDVQRIFDDLKLDSTEEGTYFAEGENAKYVYEVEAGVGMVTALPRAIFE